MALALLVMCGDDVISLNRFTYHCVSLFDLYRSILFCFRETGSMEQHAEALVALLESCLNHNLKPSHKDEDPPHAKISSDIISCIFLVS
jgi:hypothetical protein